jgi:hypothetical protein
MSNLLGRNNLGEIKMKKKFIAGLDIRCVVKLMQQMTDSGRDITENVMRGQLQSSLPDVNVERLTVAELMMLMSPLQRKTVLDIARFQLKYSGKPELSSVQQGARSVSSLPPVVQESAVEQDTAHFAEQLGKVYDIEHGNGLRTKAVMVTTAGLAKLGINIKTLFPNNKKAMIGVRKSLTFDQQKLLLEEIVKKRPQYTELLGFYNLKASQEVNSGLAGISYCGAWFWTGEMKVGNRLAAYPEPAIITGDKVSDLDGSMIYCEVGDGNWDDTANALSGIGEGVIIFGILQ